MNKTSALWNPRIFILLLAITVAWTLPAGQVAAIEARGTLEWERSLGASLRLLDVSETGNGYSVVGLNRNNHSVYLAKLHADGTVYWEKELELIAANGKRAIPASAGTTRDGGYIVGATVDGFHYRYSDYYTAKISAEGRIEWSSEYLSGSHASFNQIYEAKDGGYLFLNTTEVYLADFSKTTVGKMEANGENRREKTIASGRFTYPYAQQILELKDGGYLVAGGKDQKFYTWSLADDFTIVDEQGHAALSTGRAAATADGGYTLAGTQQGYITLYIYSSHQEPNIVPLALTGQVRSLYETAAGGYLLGTSQGVYQTNSSGEILWQYEASGLSKAIPASDGGAVVLAEGKVSKLGSGLETLEFDSDSYSLLEGQTLDTVITAVYGKDRIVISNLGEVTFSSDDESIATIDSYGNITGHKSGLTTIRAVLDGKAGSAQVYVFKMYKSLQLDSSAYRVNIGEPIDVAVSYYEGASRSIVTGESVFSTGDPSIATVDEAGKLIGLKRGQTILTAAYNGLEAKATIEVY